MTKKFLLLTLTAFFIGHIGQSQLFKKKKNKAKPEQVAKPKKDKNGIKDYNDVVTKEALSDEGLFTIHKVGKDHFLSLIHI